ncbi:MAG: type II toxin-antitoxin system VapC family toxin [Alphaproteobacteria bacterium]
MNALVIDASIAIKWVVEEDGTAEALTLRERARLIAPDLLVAECANVLWKKVQRDELSSDEALLAARLLEGADVELLPTRALFEAATRLAIELNHPAYDCLYLALAAANDCRFVTADERFLRKLDQVTRGRLREWRGRAVSLRAVAGSHEPAKPKRR